MSGRLLLAGLWLLGGAPAAGDDGGAGPVPVERMLVDRPAVDFQAPDLGGEMLSLSDFRGRVVVLNFWGIWCPPCRIEIPELLEMYRALQAEGLEILSVNTGDERKIVPAFVEENEISYPVVFDEGATDLYDVIAYPTSFVLDRSGRIRYVSEGYDPDAVPELRRVVEHLLRQPQSPEAND